MLSRQPSMFLSSVSTPLMGSATTPLASAFQGGSCAAASGGGFMSTIGHPHSPMQPPQQQSSFLHNTFATSNVAAMPNAMRAYFDQAGPRSPRVSPQSPSMSSDRAAGTATASAYGGSDVLEGSLPSGRSRLNSLFTSDSANGSFRDPLGAQRRKGGGSGLGFTPSHFPSSVSGEDLQQYFQAQFLLSPSKRTAPPTPLFSASNSFAFAQPHLLFPPPTALYASVPVAAFNRTSTAAIPGQDHPLPVASPLLRDEAASPPTSQMLTGNGSSIGHGSYTHSSIATGSSSGGGSTGVLRRTGMPKTHDDSLLRSEPEMLASPQPAKTMPATVISIEVAAAAAAAASRASKAAILAAGSSDVEKLLRFDDDDDDPDNSRGHVHHRMYGGFAYDAEDMSGTAGTNAANISVEAMERVDYVTARMMLAHGTMTLQSTVGAIEALLRRRVGCAVVAESAPLTTSH